MGNTRDTVERFYDSFAAGDLDAAMAVFDPGCVSRMPGGSLDQAGHRAMGAAFRAGLPDCRMVVDHAVETGEQIVVIGRFQGTQTGELVSGGGTIPASGKPLDLRFMDYFRVVGETIVEHETVFDQMELLGQLGALPVA
jgi:ketosteroid isomerase-like protein